MNQKYHNKQPLEHAIQYLGMFAIVPIKIKPLYISKNNRRRESDIFGVGKWVGVSHDIA